MPTIEIEMDDPDRERFTAWLEGMKDRLTGTTGRQLIIDALLPHLERLVERERSYLSNHEVSGALAASLTARSGSGDAPGTVSVFSAPFATNKQLANTWGLSSRAQHRKWNQDAIDKGTRTRKKVFYGNILHQGHRVMKRLKSGELKQVGYADPVPFASQAVDALGDEVSEAAAQDVLDAIWGKDGE